jgi:hypothetical protein
VVYLYVPTVGNNGKNVNNVNEGDAIGNNEHTPRTVEHNISSTSTEGTESSSTGWTVVTGKKKGRGTLKSEKKTDSSARSENSYHSLELIQLEN